MAATMAEALFTMLDTWLQRVEMEQRDSAYELALGAIWNQVVFMIHSFGTDPEQWREVAEFVKQRTDYTSASAVACLSVLNEISKLFVQT